MICTHLPKRDDPVLGNYTTPEMTPHTPDHKPMIATMSNDSAATVSVADPPTCPSNYSGAMASDVDRTLRAALVDQMRDWEMVTRPAVEAALRTIPRHLFVPDVPVEIAYADESIVTHRDEQGIAISSASAPSVVSGMLEQLDVQPGQRVLEIGAGTGYNAALLRHLVGPGGSVTTIDIDPAVAAGARRALDLVGFGDVVVRVGDGDEGYAPGAPYDRIIVTAGAWDVPPAWADQIAPDGRLVVPLRMRGLTRSVAFERKTGYWSSKSIDECGFMPMRGARAVPERNVSIGGDVVLRLDDGRDVDATLLHALEYEPLVVWTDVAAPWVGSFGLLDFWLAELEGFCRVLVMADAVELGLAEPVFEWGSMGALADGAFAYLTLRQSGYVEDDLAKPMVELGVCAYGPDRQADALAQLVAGQIRAWGRDRQAISGVSIEVHPTGGGDQIDSLMVIDKRYSRAIIRPVPQT